MAEWMKSSVRQVMNVIRRIVFQIVDKQRQQFTEIDYIMLTLPEKLNTLPEPTNPIKEKIFGKPAISLVEIESLCQRIACDDRAKGLILYMRPLNNPFADLQALRQSLLRLRESGKRVVCFAHSYDLRTYYVASAATDIVLQDGGDLMTTGTHSQVTFLKDALATIGVQGDFIAISPYKSAADPITRSDISSEQREQFNWILDSMYETTLEDIAAGRDIPVNTARSMVDLAPHTDETALDSGYVDAVLTEEALLKYLASKHPIRREKAERILREKWREDVEKQVVILRTGGMIVEGESRRPPTDSPVPFVGGERMGNITVVQDIRHLMKNDQAAAVVLYVDSPGGSASASEAITAALTELAATRPLVVCMGGVAASGGYYISTPAQWIVAQSGTITGSIGVLAGKLINSEMLKKLRFHTVDFTRGANAGYLSSREPFTPEQREKMTASILRIYDQFVDHVARSRDMEPDAVKAVADGRVWTGQQALEHGLVDQLGGLKEAVVKARELANLPADAPAVMHRSKDKPIAPQLAEQVNPAATLRYWQDDLQMLLNGRAQMYMDYRLDT